MDTELPKVLSKEETYELIQLAAIGSKKAQEKLVLHNIRLVKYEISQKFSKAADKEDLFQTGIIGLINAVETYKIARGYEFSTYAIKCIDNKILEFLQSQQKGPTTISINSPIYNIEDKSQLTIESKLMIADDFVELYNQKETYEIIRKLIKQLPDRDREMVELYFGFHNDKTYKQGALADKFNITQQEVSRKLKIIVKRLAEQLEAVGVIELHSKPNTRKRSKNLDLLSSSK